MSSRGNNTAQVYACDCSSAALDKARAVVDSEAGLSDSQSKRFHPFLCNLPVQHLPKWLCCVPCQQSFGASTPTTSWGVPHDIFQEPTTKLGRRQDETAEKKQVSCHVGLSDTHGCNNAAQLATTSSMMLTNGHAAAGEAVGAAGDSAFNNSRQSCGQCLGGVDVVTLVSFSYFQSVSQNVVTHQ